MSECNRLVPLPLAVKPTFTRVSPPSQSKRTERPG